jgi:hypothetical protein
MHRIAVPKWMPIALTAAGLYNLAWAAAAIAAPAWSYRLNGLEQPGAVFNPEVWQGLGLTIGLFGLGYLIAAGDPIKHWAVILVGFLGKVIGPLGFLGAALQGRMPWSAAGPILVNDVLWWLPLGLILRRAWRAYVNDEAAPQPESVEAALMAARTNTGRSLADLSRTSPVLLIGLRHLG